MTEFHIHFSQRAADPTTSMYSHRESLTDQQRTEWSAQLADQLEAAFTALKSMPVDAAKSVSVSMTVKQ